MEITDTLYVIDRGEWRAWLESNHDSAGDIWLIYYKKASGKPRIPYNDAVEEALCFGWIDSIVKGIDDERFAQRFSPRMRRSQLSDLNRERVYRLIESGRMTETGLRAIAHAFDPREKPVDSIPADIEAALTKNPDAWENFVEFPASYKRIRVGWVEMARSRPDEFQRRLRYLVKMTAKNEMYGMVQ